MAPTAEQEADILERLKNGVVEFDEEAVIDAANEAIEIGMNAYKAMMDGLAAGMDVVSRYFAEGEYYVPEVLMCADALYAGLDIVRPHIVFDSEDKAFICDEGWVDEPQGVLETKNLTPRSREFKASQLIGEKEFERITKQMHSFLFREKR